MSDSLSSLFPTSSKQWLSVKQAEIHKWNVDMIKSIGNQAPIGIKLEYCLGFLERVEE